ncbi:MAG: A/G-specific adenine glycosylase [Candidatus Diapherotrites archaeon]
MNSEKFLEWFEQNKRALPWRKNYSPFEVWISESLAQQTRMQQVVPYFEHFLKQFPTVQALAAASEEKVLKAWEGLGYYQRARNLHKAAKEIVERFDGKIPETFDELVLLPGFGPYIAAAVASIAFEEDVAVVDGNVLRVATRMLTLPEDIRLPETRSTVQKIIQEWLPKGKARNFNQALMELGATVCLPQKPLCSHCPLNEDCKAFELDAQEKFPVKSKKKKVSTRHFAALYVEQNGKILLRKRSERLLSGLYELPQVSFEPLKDNVGSIRKKFHILGVSVKSLQSIGEVFHQYTHFSQSLSIFRAELEEKPLSDFEFLDAKQLSKKPLAKVTLKALEKVRRAF